MSQQEVRQEASPRQSEPDGGLQRVLKWVREQPVFLLLIIVLYVLVLIGQASRSDVPPALTWTGPVPAGEVSLLIAHPKELVRDGSAETRQVLSVWLTYTGTVSSGSTPYLASFEPITSGVAFVDEDGSLVPPRIVLTPTIQTSMPATLHLRRATLAEDGGSPVMLTAHLFDASGQELIQDGVRLTVHLETGWKAFWRHLGEELLSPTTPLLTLAAGLVVWAMQEYRRSGQRRLELELKQLQAQRQAEHEARLAEVEKIRLLMPHRLIDAIKRYETCQQKAQLEAGWKTSEIIQSLESVRRSILKLPWRRVVLDEAVTFLSKERFAEASEAIAIVERWDPGDEDAKALRVVLEMAQVHGKE